MQRENLNIILKTETYKNSWCDLCNTNAEETSLESKSFNVR